MQNKAANLKYMLKTFTPIQVSYHCPELTKIIRYNCLICQNETIFVSGEETAKQSHKSNN